MTTNKSYSCGILTSTSEATAYDAVTKHIDKWWGPIDKPVTEMGSVVKTIFTPNPTFWTFRATRLIPLKLVELECIDAYHVHDGAPEEIRKEWLGTKLVWRIAPNAGCAKISFVHEGLVPSLLCYDICEEGWDHFLLGSLKEFLGSGVGDPGYKDDEVIRELKRQRVDARP